MKNLNYILLFICAICIVFLTWMFVDYKLRYDSPTLYEGFIVHKSDGQAIVEVIVNLDDDQMIGLDVGDPYILQEARGR